MLVCRLRVRLLVATAHVFEEPLTCKALWLPVVRVFRVGMHPVDVLAPDIVVKGDHHGIDVVVAARKDQHNLVRRVAVQELAQVVEKKSRQKKDLFFDFEKRLKHQHNN